MPTPLSAQSDDSFSKIKGSYGYIPTLDGLRAISIAMVVAAHMGLGHTLIPGGFGVTLFFFISGFLITRLLLAEHRQTSKISIVKFFIRRFLRLGPPLLAMVAGISVVYFLLHGYVVTSEILASVFYYANYYYIVAHHFEMPLGILWSIGVEEHYYLLFPLILSFGVTNLARFIRIIALTCALVLVWRIILTYGLNDPFSPGFSAGNFYTYRATDARIDSILYGALLSLILETKNGQAIARQLTDLRLVALSILILLFTFLYRDEGFRASLRYSLQGLALLPFFTALLYSPSMKFPRKILELPPSIWLGKVSYSLYLWHLGVLHLLRTAYPNLTTFEWAAIGLILMFLVTCASYYLLERPLMDLRHSLRPKKAEAALSPASAIKDMP